MEEKEIVITITVKADELLRAINQGFADEGRPDSLDDSNYIDADDIQRYILKDKLENAEIDVDSQ